MSDGERTLDATPKRVREFRQRGEIALSRDLVSAVALAGGVLALIASAGAAGHGLLDLTREAATSVDGRDPSGLVALARDGFVHAVTPVLVGAAAVALLAMLAQLGWPPAWKRPGLDLSRLVPGKQLGEAFGLRPMARRAGAALAKVAIVGALLAMVVLGDALTVDTLEPAVLAERAWNLVRRTLWALVGALLAMGAIDYVLARRRITQRMKMRPDEVRREHKEQDGDPMVRSRRKQKARELAKRRIASAVPKADVVVVNPTHYAVALRYLDGVDRAPVVVAKGVDEVAEHIRRLAREHGVPVLSRPPLTRALYKQVKEGRPIPANLYRAVAEVLAYVYRLRAPRSQP